MNSLQHERHSYLNNMNGIHMWTTWTTWLMVSPASQHHKLLLIIIPCLSTVPCCSNTHYEYCNYMCTLFLTLKGTHSDMTNWSLMTDMEKISHCLQQKTWMGGSSGNSSKLHINGPWSHYIYGIRFPTRGWNQNTLMFPGSDRYTHSFSIQVWPRLIAHKVKLK